MECIFCKIVKGEIPCHKVYETDDFLGFLDINPRNPGHTLIIPKEHHRWVWDVPNAGEYFEVVKKVANALKKSLDAELVMSLVWGNEVPHAHIWLVPRFDNDKMKVLFGTPTQMPKEQMEKIAERIINAI